MAITTLAPAAIPGRSYGSFAGKGEAVLQIYTADVLVNPSPVMALRANISPLAALDSQPSPAEELLIG